jgi:GT2 family glycosyltransferase
MKLWICIPVHNRVDFTVKCLASLYEQDYTNFTVVICDDGSTDGTALAIREKFPKAIVLEGDGNLWWTAAINRCVKYAMQHAEDIFDCIITLNDDLEVPKNYLSSLVDATIKYPGSLITSPEYDIETKRLVYPGSRHSWLTARTRHIDPLKDHLPEDDYAAYVTDATGRGTLIPLSIFKEIGLFDELRLPHYGADHDFGYRAQRAGFCVMVCYHAHVYSHVQETGLTKIREKFSLNYLHQYLTSIKSPANLKVRYRLARINCPKILLPSFLILDLFFVVGSYFKFHLKQVLKK